MLTYGEGTAFSGTVGRELADSVRAYPDVVRPKPGTPNVVLVVLDDVGYAQIGCFGSDIETPTFDRLAENGLRYRSFHTTAMCSPTRACLRYGRPVVTDVANANEVRFLELRDRAATTKAFFDHVVGAHPRFLGDMVGLVGSETLPAVNAASDARLLAARPGS